MYALVSFLLLAEEAAEAVGEAAKDAEDAPQGPNIWGWMIPMLAIFLLFQFMFGGRRRKEKRRQDELLKSMKKNDRVVTIGGLIGLVASVSNDGQEVTIKVDDNTRLKFLTNSIREVISEKSKDDDAKDDKSKS